MNENCNDCEKCGKNALWLSTFNNVALAVIAGGIAIQTGSRALLAASIHSIANIACSILAVTGAQCTEKKFDKNFPYGYGKTEFVAGAAVGIILTVVAIGILYNSIRVIVLDLSVNPPGIISFWVALLSVYANFTVSKYMTCPAQALDHPALKSISKDNQFDAYVSIPVVVCLLGSQLGLPQLDPLGACIVGLAVLKMGFQLLNDNYHALLDGSAHPETAETIKRIVSSLSEVKGIGYLKTRRAGKKILVDLQIFIESQKTVEEGNHIASDVVSSLTAQLKSIGNVHVSLKPI